MVSLQNDNEKNPHRSYRADSGLTRLSAGASGYGIGGSDALRQGSGRQGDPGTTQADNDELARRLASRDETVLKDVMARYGRWVKARLNRMVSRLTDHDLDDVIQDALLTLWKNAHQYDAVKGSVKTYFYTIARHKAIDLARRQTAYNNAKARYGQEQRGGYHPSACGSDSPREANPIRRLELQDDLAALERALFKLNKLDRVILLASVDGSRWAIRLSKELGITTSKLHQKKLRALRRLRKIMTSQD